MLKHMKANEKQIIWDFYDQIFLWANRGSQDNAKVLWLMSFFIENSFSRNRKCFTNAIVLQKLLKEIKKFNTQMLANEQTNECLSGESIKLGEWTKCFLREWKSFTNELKITKIQFFLPFLIFFNHHHVPLMNWILSYSATKQ